MLETCGAADASVSRSAAVGRTYLESGVRRGDAVPGQPVEEFREGVVVGLGVGEVAAVAGTQRLAGACRRRGGAPAGAAVAFMKIGDVPAGDGDAALLHVRQVSRDWVAVGLKPGNPGLPAKEFTRVRTSRSVRFPAASVTG
jgi:hypothetical protein